MLAFLARRMAGTLPVLALVSIFVFGFVHALPGDPARLQAGPEASPADIAAIRRDMGLDGPIWSQYLRWAGNTLALRLGRSSKTRQPVAEVIGERLMPTVWLTLVAMAWATAAGVGIGVLSGLKRGRWLDKAGMVLAISGVSFPVFWLGLLLIDDGVRAVFAPQAPPADYRARTGLDLLLRPGDFMANAQDVTHLYSFVSAQAPRMGSIAVPVAIVTGDRDGVVLSRLHSFGSARDVPGATLTVLPGVGHSPHWADPEAVVARVLEVAARAGV